MLEHCSDLPTKKYFRSLKAQSKIASLLESQGGADWDILGISERVMKLRRSNGDIKCVDSITKGDDLLEKADD